MTTHQPTSDFAIKYFPISDSQADPQNMAADDDNLVYAQAETIIPKQVMNEIMGAGQQNVVTNAGKNLMLFND